MVVPLLGEIEQNPFDGGRLIRKFNALRLCSLANE